MKKNHKKYLKKDSRFNQLLYQRQGRLNSILDPGQSSTLRTLLAQPFIGKKL